MMQRTVRMALLMSIGTDGNSNLNELLTSLQIRAVDQSMMGASEARDVDG